MKNEFYEMKHSVISGADLAHSLTLVTSQT